ASSMRGERVLPSDGSFLREFQAALAEHELFTEVRLLAPRDDAGSAFKSLSQRASGYSIVGVAAVVIKDSQDRIAQASVDLTGVGEAPYRARAVESALIGTDGKAAAIAAAAAHATDGVAVHGDL